MKQPVLTNERAEATLTTLTARLRGLHERFAFYYGSPPPAEWVAAAWVAAADSELLDELLARTEARYPGVSPRATIGNFFTVYTWQLVALGVTLMHHGVVPHLAPATTLLQFDEEGLAVGVTIQSYRYTALHDCAARGGAHLVVDNRNALRQTFVAELQTHLAPLVAALRRRAPGPESGLWLSLADRCANVTIFANRQLGCSERTPEDVEALLQLLPMRGTTGLITIDAAPEPALFLKPSTCCFAYQFPGEELCANCPRRPPAEREVLLRASLVADQE